MALIVADHPLIKHKLSIIRNKETSVKKFRDLVNEVTLLLTYEATRNLPLQEVEVATPLTTCKGETLKYANVVIAPILRAGLGMVQGMMDLFPLASVAHIGMYRDEETFQPKTYYQSMPMDMENATIFVVDPMLATAGTMAAAVTLVKEAKPKRLIGLSLIAAPEGRDRMEQEHPDVDVYCAALDEKLNDKAYIVPGLGDAGDRIFGSQKVESGPPTG
jgi:uracil phosphoribosyltransferase